MPRRDSTAAQQRRNGPYAPLSAHYARDDAILALDAAEDDLAELLFLRSLAYCAGDPRLDGYISDVALRAGVVLRRRRQENVIKRAQVLTDLGIYVREGNGYRMRSWAKWNRTHAEIEGKREADRLRKGGSPPTDDEPPPPEDRDGPPDDSPWNTNGFHAENSATPDGDDKESTRIASRGYAPASNATQRNATQMQSNAAQRSSSDTPPRGTTPPPPDLPPDIANLAGQLAGHGITVAWNLDPDDHDVIQQAINRCGTPALVKHASSRWQRDNPAFSARAFIAGWQTLPPKPQPLELVPDPCEHGFEFSSRCAHCRAKVAS